LIAKPTGEHSERQNDRRSFREIVLHRGIALDMRTSVSTTRRCTRLGLWWLCGRTEQSIRFYFCIYSTGPLLFNSTCRATSHSGPEWKRLRHRCCEQAL